MDRSYVLGRSHSWRLFVFISVCVCFRCTSSKLTAIWMAPKATPDASLNVNASTSIGALALALERIYNESILPSNFINITWRDSQCSSKQSIGLLTDFLSENHVDVIFGPPCTRAMIPVAQLSSYRNIPTFEWLGNDQSLDDKNQLNTLIRTIPPLSALGGILTLFLYGMHWYRVALITAKDMVSKAYTEALNKAFVEYYESTKVYVIHHYADVDTNITMEDLDKIYNSIKYETRILVLIVPDNEIRKYMIRADELGMSGGDYQFIFVKTSLPSKDDIIRLGTNDVWMKNDSYDESARRGFENLLYFIFGNSTNLDYWYQDGVDAAKRMFGSDPNMPEPREPDKYSKFLHDAIILYAKILNSTGLSISTGVDILRKARDISFQGLSGEVIISILGDRYPGVVVYDMSEEGHFVEVAEMHYHRDENGTVSKNYSIGIFRWGDGKNSLDYLPQDTPACGFYGELCIPKSTSQTSLIVGLSVGMVSLFLLLILIIRIWRREKNLQNQSWRVAYRSLDFEIYKRTKSLFNASVRSTRSMTTEMTEHTYQKTTLTDSFSEQIHKQGNHSVAIAKYKRSLVAVKHVRKKKVNIDRTFLKELKMLMEIKHSNLTLLRGVCTDLGHVCVLWEHCAKGSLQDILSNDDIKLDTMFKFSIAIDIARGLEYLHKSDTKFHGNLKSSSCVVDSRWTCKLTDFGPKCLIYNTEEDPNEAEDMKYAALFWTAPEFLKKAVKRKKCGSANGDIYSFGIIAKEIVTREGPYSYLENELTPKEIIGCLMNPPEGKAFRPRFDVQDSEFNVANRGTDTVKLVMKCWAQDPTKRPPIRQILKTLNRINPYKKSNVIENMVSMMEKYSNQLEDLVMERTKQLEEEKRKTDLLLYRMLPKKIADQLKTGNSVQAEAFELVTIYFSDIVGFTSLAAESSPMEIVDLLNELYTLFDDIISKYSVYKVETIGDAYMLVSGLPEKNGQDHVVQVSSAALSILSAVMKFSIPHKPRRQMQIRIGLHSGPVVAGVVGLTMPRYCLFGDTVNTASRMESTGLPLKIHISDATHDLLEATSMFHLKERGVMDIKGKGKMTTYFLEGFKAELNPSAFERSNSSESGLGIAESELDSASMLDVEQICHVSDDQPMDECLKPHVLFSMPHLPSADEINQDPKMFTDIFDTSEND